MDKKKKSEHIPRPKEDVKIDKLEPKFNEAISSFVKNSIKKSKPNDDTSHK